MICRYLQLYFQDLPTGAIEVQIQSMEVLNEVGELPFSVSDSAVSYCYIKYVYTPLSVCCIFDVFHESICFEYQTNYGNKKHICN